MFQLHAGFVNQLMACYWMDQGLEVESKSASQEHAQSMIEKIKQIRKRKRQKFTF